MLNSFNFTRLYITQNWSQVYKNILVLVQSSNSIKFLMNKVYDSVSYYKHKNKASWLTACFLLDRPHTQRPAFLSVSDKDNCKRNKLN